MNDSPATIPPAQAEPRPRGFQTIAVRSALLALAYMVAYRVGMKASIPPGNVSAIFPAAGLALGGMALFGWRLWPGVWVGSFVANYLAFDAVATAQAGPWAFAAAAAIGTGATAGAIASLALAGLRMSPRDATRAASAAAVLDDPARALRLLGPGILLGAAVSPTVGVAALAAVGMVAPEAMPYTWLTWWLGDAAGGLVVAPAAMAWWPRGPAPAPTLAQGGHRTAPAPQAPRNPPTRPAATDAAGAFETTALALCFCLLCAVVFVTSQPVVHVLLPCMAWAAYRYGARGATATIVAASGVTVAAAVLRTGPLAGGGRSVNDSLLLSHLFVFTGSVGTLLLGAARARRRRAEAELAAVNDLLEKRVAERTAALQTRTAELAAANQALADALAEAAGAVAPPPSSGRVRLR